MRRIWILVVLLPAMLGLLAGCGGENPTAVPTVIPTATTAALPTGTATTAPVLPTDTTAPPTATTEPATPTIAATATSDAEPTEEPTTEAEPSATAGGNGAGLTGSGAADWMAAFEKMKALKSYHESGQIVTTGGDTPNTVQLEGDIIPPDKAHITTTIGITETQTVQEFISIGSDSWVKIEVGGVSTWQKIPGGGMGAGFTLDFANATSGLATVERAGEDTINGVPANRYTFVANPASGDAGGLSAGDAWIAKDTGYLLRLQSKGEAPAEAGGGTTEVTFNFSRFNDPTISVEPPPATP